MGSDLVVLATTGGGAEPARSPRRELEELSLPSLRARRCALLAEADGAARWQRLVRARQDVVLALATGLEDLSVPLEAACAGGPLDVHAAADLAGHGLTEPGHGLRSLLLAGAPAGTAPPGGLEVELSRLREARRRLAGYEGALRAELAVVTDVLAERRTAALTSA
ncbi:hypothetical protein NUM3379_24310 [Kineococcus sp. NUM-3379]